MSHPLTDLALRAALPRAKPYRVFAGGGLYVQITPTGGKWWRFKYRVGGKEKLLSLGTYPAVTLAEARRRRDAARDLLARGIDPSAHRQATRAARAAEEAQTFEVVAREWLTRQATSWVPEHRDRVARRLELDVFPHVGARPIATLGPTDLLGPLRAIEARGAVETAHRVLTACGQVFRYAVATGRAPRDPTPDLKGALLHVQPVPFAAVVDPAAVGDLLRILDGYAGSVVVRAALRLAPLVFVRPVELRTAEWAAVDWEAKEWRFTTSKTRAEHLVPLARQALAVLQDLHPVTGEGRWIFPGAHRGRPLSNNAILAALRRCGIPRETMTGHGFRAMARTLLDEALQVPPHLIEHQLAHRVRDPLGRSYNRTTHRAERHVMMQAWADYLDTLRVAPVRDGQSPAAALDSVGRG